LIITPVKAMAATINGTITFQSPVSAAVRRLGRPVGVHPCQRRLRTGAPEVDLDRPRLVVLDRHREPVDDPGVLAPPGAAAPR